MPLSLYLIIICLNSLFLMLDLILDHSRIRLNRPTFNNVIFVDNIYLFAHVMMDYWVGLVWFLPMLWLWLSWVFSTSPNSTHACSSPNKIGWASLPSNPFNSTPYKGCPDIVWESHNPNFSFYIYAHGLDFRLFSNKELRIK